MAGVTDSQILIKDAPVEHLESTLLGFRRLGLNIQVEGGNLSIATDKNWGKVWLKGEAKILFSAHINIEQL